MRDILHRGLRLSRCGHDSVVQIIAQTFLDVYAPSININSIII